MTHIFDEQMKIVNPSDDPVIMKVINPSDDPVIVDAELMSTDDVRALGLLEQILTSLRKIEYHLSIATDTELNDQDVGG